MVVLKKKPAYDSVGNYAYFLGSSFNLMRFFILFQITALFQFTLRMAAEVEARFTSVERLNHFVKTLKPEGKFVTEDKKLSRNWPSDGSIIFDNAAVSVLKCFLRQITSLKKKIKDYLKKKQELVALCANIFTGRSSLISF